MSGAAQERRAERDYDAARRLMDLGKPRAALARLRRAETILAGNRAGPLPAAAVSMADLRARILITRAYAEFELDGLPAAIETLDQAAALISQFDLPLELRLHGQRGMLLIRAGRPDEAAAELTRASQFVDEVAPLDRCRVLLNRGVAHQEAGDYVKAWADYSACAAAARAAGLVVLQVKATHNLGVIAFLQGNLPHALELMDEAIGLDPTVSPGIAKQGKARVLIEAGMTREADDALAEAAEIFRRDRLPQDLSTAELDRARCALAAQDAAAARRLAARARDRWRRRGDVSWQRSAELVLLQGDLAAGRPPARLLEPAERVRDSFTRSGLDLPARTAGRILAEIRLRSGDQDGAERALAESRPRPDDPVSSRLHHREVSARLALARGRTGSATHQIRAGLDELARYQASFGSIDLRAAAAVHGRHLAELGMSVALNSGSAQRVFTAAEQARAVTSRLMPVRPPDDPELGALLSELRQVIESLGTAAPDRGVADLGARRTELERAIAARTWVRSGSDDAIEVAPAVEVLDAAQEDAATVLVLVQVGTGLHGLVSRGGRLGLHDLGDVRTAVELVRRLRADLNALAHAYLPEPLRAAASASMDKSIRALDEQLLGPLYGGPARGAGQRRLVVIPTGIFGQLPWGLLPRLRCVPVVVAPSGTAWLRCRRGSSMPESDVVCLAGPGLVRAVGEVDHVAQVWREAGVRVARVLAQVDATSTALHQECARASVLHVAAHGTHQTENPLFSSLRLADGPLFAHELDLAGGVPEHVVLSACELGLATVRPGDEALGLTSVLLHLGSRSVVAGVARVGDDVAADTMTRYHRELAGGADSAQALATALAATDPDRPAPFVCFGSAWSA